MRRRDRPPRASRNIVTNVSLQRRRLAQCVLLPAASGFAPAAWAEAVRISSARLWPALEYTRVIVETTGALAYQLHSVPAPYRLVLDIDNVDAGNDLAQLPVRVQPTDPYIAAIRLGRRSATAIRIVLDLKGEVKPDVFALK